MGATGRPQGADDSGVTGAPADGRAVVTGLGVVAPNGLGVDRFWSATLRGQHGIEPLTRFDTAGYPSVLAGQVSGFDPRDHLPDRLLPQTDLSTQLALVAADQALQDAKVDPGVLTDYDMGVVTGNASGGFDFTHREFDKLWARGPRFVSVYESFAWFYAVNTGQVSIRHGLRGPSTSLVAEQASGLDAVGHARRTLRRGTPLVVAGGVDSALDPWGWASHLSSGRVSTDDDPATAYRPFAADASGWVPGEGGAFLVLERADAARARPAQQVYGEIAGYASTFDPRPGSSRPLGLQRAAELALTQAGVAPRDVDLVVADAAAAPELDRGEADALRGLFGPRAVEVTTAKPLTGRLLAGGGPLDLVVALLAIRDGTIPPTTVAGLVPEAYGIDLVRGAPRQAEVATALVWGRGRWGFNSAVVVRRVDLSLPNTSKE
jgi:act minimal PKS chain-length factor (CLF/KS beta)